MASSVLPTEKDIESAIIAWLNYQQGCLAFKVETQGVYDEKKNVRRKAGKGVIPGTADIICCYKGHFISIEVKTPLGMRKYLNNPGDTELNQRHFAKMVQGAGGTGLAVCSLEMVQDYFRSLRSSLNGSAAPKHQFS